VLGIDEGEARVAWDALGPSALKSVAVDSEAETFLAARDNPSVTLERQDDTRTKTHDDDLDDPPTTFQKR
jgi:hypothetical protein